MDAIIKKQESKLLSDSDLFQIAEIRKGDHNYIRHSDLAKVRDLNEYMDQCRGVLVILWESAPNYGHWTCLARHAKRALEEDYPLYEFFDSYGLAPDEELKFGDYGRPKALLGKPVLTPLLDSCGFPWTYNHKKLQAKYENVNTCGRYVGLRLLFRGLSLEEFVDLLTKNKYYNPDFWVSVMTIHI